MKHTLIYMGRMSLNFDKLSAATTEWVSESREKRPLDMPAEAVDGIAFGYMETGSKHFAVKIGDVVLGVPLPLESDRHCDGKGFGPKPSQFGDASAQALVADAITCNPKQAEKILRTVWGKVEKT